MDNLTVAAVLLVFFILVVMIVFLNVLIAIVSDSYDLSMAKAEGLFLAVRCELITETALIASLLPTSVPADARRSDDQGEPRLRAPPSDQTS